MSDRYVSPYDKIRKLIELDNQQIGERETTIETPIGRARWILATDSRGTQAELDAFDAALQALDLNAGMREALRRSESAMENARRFLDELPHFRTEPDANGKLDLSLWHYHREANVSGLTLVLDLARVALAGEGGPAAEEDG